MRVPQERLDHVKNDLYPTKHPRSQQQDLPPEPCGLFNWEDGAPGCTLTHHYKSFSHPQSHAHTFICINIPCLTLAYIHIPCSHMLFHTSYTHACMYAHDTVMQPSPQITMHSFTHTISESAWRLRQGCSPGRTLSLCCFQECGRGRLCPHLPLRIRSCRDVCQSSLQGKGGI